MSLLLNKAGDHVTRLQTDEALSSYFPMCSVQRTQKYLAGDKIHDLGKPGKKKK